MNKDMMKNMTSKVLAFLCLIMTVASIAGCATAPRTIPVPDGPNDYILGTGDALRITVFGQEGLSGEFRVDASGNISFPLLNSVPAAGFTTAQLEKDITDKLDPDYIVDPRVSVEVITYRTVYVLGEVRTPGRYEFSPNMTAMQAIAAAGGYTYRANEDTAELTRHVKGAIKTFTIDQMTMIKPGDTIVVKRRWF